jgi:hypothetical protein
MSNPTTTAGILKAAYEASLRQAGHADNDDQDSIASSAGSVTARAPAEAPSKAMYVLASTTGQADDLSDFEDDMDVDVDEKPLTAAPVARLVQPQASQPARHPLHSSLPPRPGSMVTGYPFKPPPPNQAPPPLPPPTFSFSGSASQSHNQNLQPAAQSPLLPLVAPQPKVPQPFVAHELAGQAIASFSSSSQTPAQSSSDSTSSTASTTPIPSEPKAMKNAPTEPSYTKRALMARQKELEEKIAKSKLELAAAAAKSAAVSGSTTPTTATTTAQPPGLAVPTTTPMATPKPSMDLGEKQLMEDRLRKLVLQSQKARGKGKVEATTTAPVPLPPPQQQQNRVVQPTTGLSASATVSISSHSFSLEDMAVSFITQTIETIKSQPSTSPSPVVLPAIVATKPPPPTSNSNSNVRLELAAKQKRLEEHISESKALMAKLSQARSKEEKDGIMKAMREKSRWVLLSIFFPPWWSILPFFSVLFPLRIYLAERTGFFPPSLNSYFLSRLFEEGSHAASAAPSPALTTESKSQSQSPALPPQQFQNIRWPNSHEDAGVFVLSDDSDSDSDSD